MHHRFHSASAKRKRKRENYILKLAGYNMHLEKAERYIVWNVKRKKKKKKKRKEKKTKERWRQQFENVWNNKKKYLIS